IRARDSDRDRSQPRSRPVSNFPCLIISTCHEAQIIGFAASMSDLRETADRRKPAILLGALRPDRSRPMAQRQLWDPDRGDARRGRRGTLIHGGIVIDGTFATREHASRQRARGGSNERVAAGELLWGHLRRSTLDVFHLLA